MMTMVLFTMIAFGYQESEIPAYKYGNILISRTSIRAGIKPATFSHWLHRRYYTCRVCHFELEFEMRLNTTRITEAENKQGKYCGASGCHDGKRAFGHDEGNCEKCHNGRLSYGKEKFSELSELPEAMYGDKINWVAALKKGMISPKNYIFDKPNEMEFDKLIVFSPQRSSVSPSVFPHKEHIDWLDCANCHPDIFNIKRKGTRHFSKAQLMQGKFCGVCHGTVAFPLMDCQRCHKEIR